MIRPLFLGLFALIPILFSSCTTDGNVAVGGIPAWLAAGAKLDSEPAPYKPDPAIIHYDSSSGPLQFKIVTNQDDQKTPKAAPKKSSGAPVGNTAQNRRQALVKRLLN